MCFSKQLQTYHVFSSGGGGTSSKSANQSDIATICSWCGRARHEGGTWMMEDRVHFPGGVSHSVCPDCYQQAIPSMIRELNENTPN